MRLLVLLTVLLEALLFLGSARDAAGAEQPLSTVAAVRALSREEAAKGLPVRVTGVVTYHEPSWFLTFVQDQTAGIYISAMGAVLRPGDKVVVEGISAPGGIGRIITGPNGTDAKVTVVGTAPMPTAIVTEPAHLRDPTYDAQFVSVQGDVRTVQRINDRAVLDLTVAGKTLRVMLPGYDEGKSLPRYFRGASVVATGVFGTSVDARGVQTGGALHVTGEDHIAISGDFLTRAFERPIQTFGSFYETSASSRGTRLHFRGVASFVRPQIGFFLMLKDGEGWGPTAWVQTTQPFALKPGQLVDVSGYAEMSNRKPQIRDGLIRPGEMTPFAQHSRVEADKVNSGDHGRLITIRGTLLEQRHGLGEEFLLIQAGKSAVCARLESSGQQLLPPFLKGSTLELSGACVDLPPTRNEPQPFTFELWIQRPEDVSLVRAPSWWTAERIAWALTGTGIISLIATIWAVLLRRKIQRQTRIIRQQLEREAVSHERTRIARDFHDTLEQHFAGISMQLDAIAERVRVRSPETVRLVDLARELTRHSREEARHVIWELRAPKLGSENFPQELEKRLLPIATQAHLELSVCAEGTVRPLSARMENHLLRIAQEALTNTLKHAGATRVGIALDYTGPEVALTFSDNGRGFESERQLSNNEGFGLCGMRERADRLNGTLHVKSEPGRGVTVEVRCPMEEIAGAAL